MDPTKKKPDERVYVGSDVNYVGGGAQKPCTKCGTLAWISPAGLKFLATTAVPVVCMSCGTDILKQDDKPEMELCPGSLDEIRNYFRRN